MPTDSIHDVMLENTAAHESKLTPRPVKRNITHNTTGASRSIKRNLTALVNIDIIYVFREVVTTPLNMVRITCNR